ncbi:hypothetical protein [Anaerocolumna chitinilytica]|uniref:Uncharacterized protein n=1 Tax=Anaerocolumna chitinilytica TaxID=1727145 RepID=A0A7I8DGV7_9FIRM|nr:hypothetical protein [Anaerocolumna chitinilytica]BCJ97748.1 hypothetical protein bsdcttw_07890 [Anaerocolumna chitinilytica]
MRKFKRMIQVILISVLILCILIHFLPVRLEAIAYGNNYKTYIYYKYVGEVVSLYADNHKEYRGVSAQTLSNYKISYKGRRMYLDLELKVTKDDKNLDTITGEFVGKRIWIGVFSWKER